MSSACALLSLAVTLCFSTSSLSAQPVLDESAPQPFNVCGHPQATKVSGYASLEFLHHDKRQRQVLVISEDQKIDREQLLMLQNLFALEHKNPGISSIRIGGLFTSEEVLDSAYPPVSKTPYYSGDQISQKMLWRSCGWLAPDLVVIWKSDRGTKLGLPDDAPEELRKACREFYLPVHSLKTTHLAGAVSAANPTAARVGTIPAVEITCPAPIFVDTMVHWLNHLAQQKLPKVSPAHQELLKRRARTPVAMAQQLDKVYGHHLNKVMYQPALSLIARMHLDDLLEQTSRHADVENIVAEYVSNQKPTLGNKASGSVTAGHLVFADLAQRVDKERYTPLVIRAADQILNDDGTSLLAMPAHNEMSDAVFMGGPILAAAGRLTGDERYYDLCLKHVRFMQNLCLREDGLYRHSPLDEAAWGRGNGFPALGLALALSEIPESHPVHQELRKDFRRHLLALTQHQDPTGMWHQVIDKPGSYREMTATCMITFAMVRGLRNGWLDELNFQYPITQAWPAIQDRISEQGELIDVCTGTGKQKNEQAYFDRTAILGKDERGGAMAFLAVTEYARYLREQ